jgi:hypothetical protein
MRYVISFLGRKIRGLQSCPVVGGIPLLEEWPLSFDDIATCPDIRDPVDDAATTHRVMIIPVAMCLSLWFDWRREPRPRRRESWCDFTPFEEIEA